VFVLLCEIQLTTSKPTQPNGVENDLSRSRVTLTFDHLTPEVDKFHALVMRTSCANWHQNWFIHF